MKNEKLGMEEPKATRTASLNRGCGLGMRLPSLNCVVSEKFMLCTRRVHGTRTRTLVAKVIRATWKY